MFPGFLSGRNFIRLFVCCQLLFYVTSSLVAAENLSSDLLPGFHQREKIRMYYPKHLDNLRDAVPPRMVQYVDARNYSLYGSMKVEGILFTIRNPRAKQVFFVMDQDNFRHRPMIRNNKGVWYAIVPPLAYDLKEYNPKIRYKYLVDGLFTQDVTHDNFEEDGANSFISIFQLDGDFIRPREGYVILKQKLDYGRKVVFRIYAPQARHAGLLGNFNDWNPELDVMKKNERGYFELEKVLPPGEYIYLYKVDGLTRVDEKNPDLRRHPVLGPASYLKIQK